MQGSFNISKITMINSVNKLKKKSSMIILIDVGREFVKIKYPFMITLSKLKTEVNFFNLIYKILLLSLMVKN